MLHKVERPDCKKQMRTILRFQFKVLAFACNKRTTLPLTDIAVFKKKLGKGGEWLYERVQEKKEFREALEKLIKYIGGDDGKRQQLLRAFLNDREFHKGVKNGDVNFRFSYRTLNQLAKEAVSPLMKLFYGYLLELGFPKELFSDNTKFDRKAFVKFFWDANADMNLCPACDGKKPPEKDCLPCSENDHYLPKHAYPYLSIHPSNLLPTCKYCNQSYKGQTDPIDDHSIEPLLRSFYPYERPARDFIRLEVMRKASRDMRLSIKDKTVGNTKRIENLNNILSLESRWLSDLKEVKENILESLSSAKHLYQRLKSKRSSLPLQNDVITHLANLKIQKEKKIGKKHGALLEVAYLDYAVADAKELNNLIKEAGL